MFTPIIIAIMMALGIISSEADIQNMSQDQQEYYQDIIIDDGLQGI